MRALELIRRSGLPSDQLATVESAFEGAWLELRTQFGKEISAEHARIRLASIILLLTRIIKDDPDRLMAAAVRVFNSQNE